MTRVMVTGATGTLGSKLVQKLLREGYGVRALIRSETNSGAPFNAQLEVVAGNVAEKSAVRRAMQGCSIVVHAAADTSGKSKDAELSTIGGTRNIIEIARESNIERLVYISSCSVYDVAGRPDNAIISEDSSLEPHPERRGIYSASKRMAEVLMTTSIEKDGLPAVILRPGTIYGSNRSPLFTMAMGIAFGKAAFLVFGNGAQELPLVHVDNLVDAILLAMKDDKATGEIFNVLDEDGISKRVYMQRIIQEIYPSALVIYVPLPIVGAMMRAVDWVTGTIGLRTSPVWYRFLSSQKPVHFDSSKIRAILGWRPAVDFARGAARVVLDHSAQGAGQ